MVSISSSTVFKSLSFLDNNACRQLNRICALFILQHLIVLLIFERLPYYIIFLLVLSIYYFYFELPDFYFVVKNPRNSIAHKRFWLDSENWVWSHSAATNIRRRSLNICLRGNIVVHILCGHLFAYLRLILHTLLIIAHLIWDYLVCVFLLDY